MRSLLSTSAEAHWRALNPFLDAPLVTELLRLTATMLLAASAISVFNLMMTQCVKLLGMLGALRESALALLELSSASSSASSALSTSSAARAAARAAEEAEDAQQLEAQRRSATKVLGLGNLP